MLRLVSVPCPRRQCRVGSAGVGRFGAVTSGPDAVQWVVVIAAKRLDAAKSRLASATGDYRAELALGMLLDTISAARAAVGVVAVMVVTDDEQIAGEVTSAGAAAVADRGDSLNAAFRQGITTAVQQHPGAGVVLLAGDLPALRPAELGLALQSAKGGAAIAVADHEGSGTTMLAARTPATLRPSFGADSFARHRAGGAVGVSGGLEGLRQDVDTPADLETALELGVGPATASASDRVCRH
jgi:2-phospho-L-lactate/phosphoenolpyruvate guanylyltransferase